MDIYYRCNNAPLERVGHLELTRKAFIRHKTDEDQLDITVLRDDLAEVLGGRVTRCECWRLRYIVEYDVPMGEYEAYAWLIGCHTVVLRPPQWAVPIRERFSRMERHAENAMLGMEDGPFPPEIVEQVVAQLDDVKIDPEMLLPSRGCLSCSCYRHHSCREILFHKDLSASYPPPCVQIGVGMTGGGGVTGMTGSTGFSGYIGYGSSVGPTGIAGPVGRPLPRTNLQYASSAVKRK